MADPHTNNVMPMAETIRDIELPMAPTADYLWVLQSLAWALALLLVLLLSLWLLSQYRGFNKNLFTAPLIMRFRLRKLSRKFDTDAKLQPQSMHVSMFYYWLSNFHQVLQQAQKQYSNLTKEQTLLTVDKEVLQLKQNLEYQLFSREPVSRETFISTLHHAEILFHKTMSLKFIVQCFYRAFFARAISRNRPL